MLCSGLRLELAKQPHLEIVGQAANAPEAATAAAKLGPDLVVMDIHMPGADGVMATRQILQLLRAVKVIIFSADSDQLQVDEALRAGACGYVLKSGAVDELVRAIDVVLQGRMYVSSDLTSGILQGYREALMHVPTSGEPTLSEKEKQLLRLLANGKRSKEMAEQLHLSPSSVETYRLRIKKKLGLQSTAELVRFAISNKIVEL